MSPDVLDAGVMAQIPDFRPDIADAQRWAAGLMAGVRPAQLDDPTPCTEYDVRALLEHMCALPAKLTTVAEGGSPHSQPHRVPIVETRVADDYRRQSRDALEGWADDELLTRTVTAPFGPAPGGLALGAFFMETLAHGWDLAVATGQDPEADPALVAKARAVAERALTDDARGPGRPFGHRAEPRADSGPTEEFAALLGRSWRPGRP